MLKLFQIPTKSTLKTVKNLNTEFGQLINEHKILRKAQKKKHDEEVRKTNVISNKIRLSFSHYHPTVASCWIRYPI